MTSEGSMNQFPTFAPTMRRTIKLPYFDLAPFPQVRVGNAYRHATATAVKWVDKDHILAAQFLSRSLYLIDIRTTEVLAYAQTEGFIDLFDFKDGLIATAEYPFQGVSGGVTLLRLSGNEITLERHIDLDGYYPHGVDIVDDGTFVVTSTNDNKALLVIDEDGVSSDRRPFNIKDVTQFEHGAVAVQCTDRPGHAPDKRLAAIGIMDGHQTEFIGMPDALAMEVNRAYVTVQDRNCVEVFDFDGDRFKQHGTIEGFNFPHGCDVLDGVLAVSNYGDNTITLIDL
jgi:DNA-binding beta-propeller fold protein YncE